MFRPARYFRNLRRNRRSRGLTLLELMTVAAVSSIMLTAATAVFVNLTKMRRDGDRFLELESDAATAMLQIQTDVQNAGYRFPGSAFAAHIYNAPATLTAGRGGTSVIDTAGGCATGGLVPGSDAIEVLSGTPLFQAGRINTALPGAAANERYVNMFSDTPFTAVEPGIGAIVLLAGGTDASGESCMGRVTMAPGSGGALNHTLHLTMLDRDFNDVGNASTYYPNCPRANMDVYRLTSRRRYLVCTSNLPDAGTNPGIYRQDAQPETGLLPFSYDTTTPLLVQDGIEDMQLAARVYARAGVLSAAASAGTGDCGPSTGPVGDAGEGYCYCNQSPTSACDIEADPGLTVPNVTVASTWSTWVAGVRMSLVSIGDRRLEDILDGGRPAVKDNPAGNYNGRRRLVLDTNLGMLNLSQVHP